MIARLWKGRTSASDGEAYVEVLKRTGVEACRATPGNAGVFVLYRIRGEVAEFQFLSLWDSHAAIRRFAGPEPERAVYYPEDDAYLLEKEPEVAHFEVFSAAPVETAGEAWPAERR